jgi:multiple sugar transport system substrate-binding protein
MSGTRVSRRTALARLGVWLSAGASACTRSRPIETLRVAYAPITFAKLYEAVAAAFMQAHPGLTIKLMPATNAAGTMPRDFTLALVDDEPDVSHVGLNQIRFYAERNLALPLDRYIEAEALPLTAHRTIGKIGGETRALPFAVSVPVNYFNNDLVARAGHDPRSLTRANWREIVAIATDISALRHPISGFFFDYNGGQALTWQMLVLGYGGRMMSTDERTIAFGDRTGLSSAKLLDAIGRSGQVDMSRENARMAFASRLLGGYTNTSSNMERFSSANMGFDVTMAPVPIEPGIGTRPAAGNAVVITTRNPSRQANAWKYVRFATGPIGQTIMARLSGYLTLNPAPLADPDLLKPHVDAHPHYKALYAMADTLDQWYAFPGPRSEQIAKGIVNRMRAILIGREQPEQALTHMVKEAQRLVNWR